MSVYISGVSTDDQTGSIATFAVLTLAGQPRMIYDVPQVVNVTYQVQTGYIGTIRRNDGLIRTDFRLVQGVQNDIFVFVRDHSRHWLPNANLTLNLTSPESLLLSCPLTWWDTNGRYLTTLLPSDVAQLPIGAINWHVAYQRDDQKKVLLWTEQNLPYGFAVVLKSPIPDLAAAKLMVWDDFSPLTAAPNANQVLTPPLYHSSPLIGAAQQPYANGQQSFAFSMTNFTGTIRIDGSLMSQPEDSPSSLDWFQVDSRDYMAFTGDATMVEQGCFVWLRIVVTMATNPYAVPGYWTPGSLDRVLYTVS